MRTDYNEPITIKVGRKTEVFAFGEQHTKALTKRNSSLRLRIAEGIRSYRSGNQGAAFVNYGTARPVFINAATLPIKSSKLVRILWGPGSWRP